MKELKVRLMERILGAEPTSHLGSEAGTEAPAEQTSRRKGGATRRLTSSDGGVPLTVPRDRDGSFAPEPVKKRQTRIDWVDDKSEPPGRTRWRTAPRPPGVCVRHLGPSGGPLWSADLFRSDQPNHRWCAGRGPRLSAPGTGPGAPPRMYPFVILDGRPCCPIDGMYGSRSWLRNVQHGVLSYEPMKGAINAIHGASRIIHEPPQLRRRRRDRTRRLIPKGKAALGRQVAATSTTPCGYAGTVAPRTAQPHGKAKRGRRVSHMPGSHCVRPLPLPHWQVDAREVLAPGNTAHGPCRRARA